MNGALGMFRSVTDGVVLLGEKQECGSPGWRGPARGPRFNIGIFLSKMCAAGGFFYCDSNKWGFFTYG